MRPRQIILRHQAVPHFSEAYIAGVDEVGRGALAGPVVAAAVILDARRPVEAYADSKKLSAKRRGELAKQIKDTAQFWAVGSADHSEIDQLNILNATLLAMQRAIEGLGIKPQRVLIDGNRCPPNDIPSHAIIGGDARVACIAAASIVAKTTRDRQMCLLGDDYPQYHFATHKGYATRVHRAALIRYGSCPVHRISWKKVQELVAQSPYPLAPTEHRKAIKNQIS